MCGTDEKWEWGRRQTVSQGGGNRFALCVVEFVRCSGEREGSELERKVKNTSFSAKNVLHSLLAGVLNIVTRDRLAWSRIWVSGLKYVADCF
jgi:hypothetical protein